MPPFEPQDPEYEPRVRASFESELPYGADLCQQHGFVHATMLATLRALTERADVPKGI